MTWDRVIRSRESGLALLLLLLIGAVSVRYPQFAAPAGIADTLDDTSILMLLALGQMLVILTRAIRASGNTTPKKENPPSPGDAGT